MNDYQFEYTDNKYELKLWGISILLLFGLLILLPLCFKDYISPIVDVVLIIGIPVSFFLDNKKKIKKSGFAKILDDSIDLRLSDFDRFIKFKDIKIYNISGGRNSLWISLHLSDDSKVKIICNTNFCDWKSFDKLQKDLEDRLNIFAKESDVKIDKMPSPYVKKIATFILSILTLGLIAFIFLTKFPEILISIPFGAGLITAWIQFIIAVNEKK